MQATESYSPSVINTHINGRPGFATGDIVQAHPSVERWFKVYGRADEIIVLSTGEKTNPVPLGEWLLNEYLVCAELKAQNAFYVKIPSLKSQSSSVADNSIMASSSNQRSHSILRMPAKPVPFSAQSGLRHSYPCQIKL